MIDKTAIGEFLNHDRARREKSKREWSFGFFIGRNFPFYIGRLFLNNATNSFMCGFHEGGITRRHSKLNSSKNTHKKNKT